MNNSYIFMLVLAVGVGVVGYVVWQELVKQKQTLDNQQHDIQELMHQNGKLNKIIYAYAMDKFHQQESDELLQDTDELVSEDPLISEDRKTPKKDDQNQNQNQNIVSDRDPIGQNPMPRGIFNGALQRLSSMNAQSNAPQSNVPQSNVPQSVAPQSNAPQSNAPAQNTEEAQSTRVESTTRAQNLSTVPNEALSNMENLLAEEIMAENESRSKHFDKDIPIVDNFDLITHEQGEEQSDEQAEEHRADEQTEKQAAEPTSEPTEEPIVEQAQEEEIKDDVERVESNSYNASVNKEDSLKRVYKDNPHNRKLGRVGQQY